MLVLTRKPGESLLIGDQIEVCVVKKEGGRVVLGITAPPAIVILRSELEERYGPVSVPAEPRGRDLRGGGPGDTGSQSGIAADDCTLGDG